MPITHMASSGAVLPQLGLTTRIIASYERELAARRRTELELRKVLAQKEALVRQKDNLISKQQELSTEADHRLLNNVQMIASLLSLQSHRTSNVEAASELGLAANRVATIGRVHQRLHSFDGVQSVAFRRYVEDLCQDFSTMMSLGDETHGQVISVTGSELSLPAATAIPLGFIVNELLTNAAKYGKGAITVRLENADGRYALSVASEGPPLPEGFDPAGSKGLGMKIIAAFIQRIGAKLQVDRGETNQGARFTVLFS